jgi:hypothetical protein
VEKLANQQRQAAKKLFEMLEDFTTTVYWVD